jgi:hypothetical protein
MERAGYGKLDLDRCSNLMWKGMFVLSESDQPHSNDRLFWCHKTQQCTGPDGKLADDYECNETRDCYREL